MAYPIQVLSGRVLLAVAMWSMLSVSSVAYAKEEDAVSVPSSESTSPQHGGELSPPQETITPESAPPLEAPPVVEQEPAATEPASAETEKGAGSSAPAAAGPDTTAPLPEARPEERQTVSPMMVEERVFQPAPSGRRLEFGIGTWISTGHTKWAHNASSQYPLGNPTSRLTYADHTTNVVEFTGTLWVGPRVFGRLNGGFADIGGGRLTDDDFLVQDGGQISSRTHSDIKNSSMHFINAEMGVRMRDYAGGRGMLDAVVGFQYWHQEHQAYGVRQISCSNAGATVDLDSVKVGTQPLCNPGQAPISNSVLAITNKASWYSIRAGLQTEYAIMERVSLQGSLLLKPLTVFHSEDTHHLRSSDLLAPSFTMFGVGMGADAEAGARVMITNQVALNVGYRVWWNRMIDGTWKNHPVSGASSSVPLVEYQTIRHGLTAGITVRF